MFGNSNWSTALQGVTPEYFQARDWVAVSGRLLTPDDVDAASKVVVLGQTVAENLFGGTDPIDQTVRIKAVPVHGRGRAGPEGAEHARRGPGRHAD